MAEEEDAGVQNIWLLLIAVGLGLIVLVVYNVHIYQVRQEGRGRTVVLLRLTRSVERGQRIEEGDVAEVPVTESMAKGLGNVILARDKQAGAVDSVVNRNLGRGDWLLWEYTTKEGSGMPSNPIDRGKVSFVVPVDQRKCVGMMLRTNARVNVLGMMPVGSGGELKAVRIIKWARVLEVGGVASEPGKTDATAGGMRTYNAVTIEVAEDVGTRLSNIMTHVSGGCWVELVSSKDTPPKDSEQISRELDRFAGAAAAVKRPGSL